MAEVQAMGKPQDVKNCYDLEKCFADYIMQKYKDSDQLWFIFDRYDVEKSLKVGTRERRQGGQP